MPDITSIIRAGLETIGATGLVNTDIQCGCGLDDFMPCCEPCPDCEAAYAVLCDGTNCESCEARPYPPRVGWETVCFTVQSNIKQVSTDASGASSSPYTDCVKSNSIAECVELGCCACDGPLTR